MHFSFKGRWLGKRWVPEEEGSLDNDLIDNDTTKDTTSPIGDLVEGVQDQVQNPVDSNGDDQELGFGHNGTPPENTDDGEVITGGGNDTSNDNGGTPVTGGGEDPPMNENPVTGSTEDPEEEETPVTGGGGAGGGGGGMMSGEFQPKWGDLFAYTTLTTPQKVAIKPMVDYIKQAKGMLS